jgi:hypothetical protein
MEPGMWRAQYSKPGESFHDYLIRIKNYPTFGFYSAEQAKWVLNVSNQPSSIYATPYGDQVVVTETAQLPNTRAALDHLTNLRTLAGWKDAEFMGEVTEWIGRAPLGAYFNIFMPENPPPGVK